MVHLNITNLRKYYMVFVCFDWSSILLIHCCCSPLGFFHEVLTFKQTTYTPIACVKSLWGIFTVLRFRIFHRKLLKNKNKPNTSFLHSAENISWKQVQKSVSTYFTFNDVKRNQNISFLHGDTVRWVSSPAYLLFRYLLLSLSIQLDIFFKISKLSP